MDSKSSLEHVSTIRASVQKLTGARVTNVLDLAATLTKALQTIEQSQLGQ